MQEERHRAERVGWLRAAVLGANDGLLSTSSLILGVAAAQTGRGAVLTAGLAGMVAGAMSMAAGEYVSVYSQADTEAADLAMEREELRLDPAGEERELAGIYERRGLTPELAAQVAAQLMAGDALQAHARDELGMTDELSARPVQAAVASAASFMTGAALPLVVGVMAPHAALIPLVAVISLVGLAVLGGVAARVGGASVWKGAARVVFWGVLAMLVTLGVGRLFGTRVG